jgi:hypothetical protein
MTDHDPNEAYEVVPIEPGPHGPPEGWWTVKRNGIPVRHFPGKEKAQRFATDPEYRASLITEKAWERQRENDRSTSSRPPLDDYGRRYATEATGFRDEATADCSKDETLHRSHPIANFPFQEAPEAAYG